MIAILVLTAIGAWPLVARGTLIGQDAAAYYYPAYAFLGDRLRAFELPIWNPYWLSGAPFAADPQSGWMYAPAMLLFTILPLPLAIDAFLIFHLLLAGLATYALARTLGMGSGGALVAGVAFEFTGVVYGRAACCPGYYQAASWLPAMLLCADRGLRARTWRGRIGWWAGGGFALSQILAIWLGQGAYYALLALGSFLAYRSLLDPPVPLTRWSARLGTFLLHGTAMLALGFGFAAAGLLPRLEFHALSNLARGYTGNAAWAARQGGWDYQRAVTELLSPSLYDIGGATVAVAILALIVARGRFAAPYFAGLTVAALVLSSPHETPVYRVLAAVLPKFDTVHLHYPERTMLVGALGPALLAGAAVSAAPRARIRPSWLAAVGALVAMAIITVRQTDNGTAEGVRLAIALAALAALAAMAMTLRQRISRHLPAVLVVLIFLDLFAAGQWFRDNAPYGGFHEVKVDEYYGSSGAASWLQDRGEEGVRFYGYDPALHRGKLPRLLYYRYHFADPEAMALIANNRGTVLGLEDVQGYNPIQLQRYVEFMDAVNGQAQEYHGAYVLPTGIKSPLLNLLGARYVVVPDEAPRGRADLAWLRERLPTVYQDVRVRVLDNVDAYPRAWLVHEARRAPPGTALDLLRQGQIDPRRTAVLEEAIPPLGRLPEGTIDEATLLQDDPSRIRIRTRSEVDSLLMVNVVHYPSWQASVDGQIVPTYVADHLFTAVAVPAGEHVVELRQVSEALRLGLAITGGVTVATLIVVAALPTVGGIGDGPGRRRRRPAPGWRPLRRRVNSAPG